MKELYIDFDGVILNTIPLLYHAAESAGKSKSDGEFYSQYDFKQILKDEYIINNSIECINKIIASGKFNVSILTHVNSLNEGIEKVNYIRRFFKDITVIIVPKQISKTKMVHTEGAILVDDYSGNLREWEQEKGISIRFNVNKESEGFTVIDSLDEIIDMF